MQGLTAQYLCQVAVSIPKDAVVLVHSAGSGVGRMLTQLVTYQGARVIATVSRGHKAHSAREAGAWRVLVRDETPDLGAAIRELVDGTGVDIAFDGTGNTLFEVSVSALRVGGTFVTYGYAGGHIPPISLWEQPHGVRLVAVRGAPEESIGQWRRRASQVMRWIEEGTLEVLIDRTYGPGRRRRGAPGSRIPDNGGQAPAHPLTSPPPRNRLLVLAEALGRRPGRTSSRHRAVSPPPKRPTTRRSPVPAAGSARA